MSKHLLLVDFGIVVLSRSLGVHIRLELVMRSSHIHRNKARRHTQTRRLRVGRPERRLHLFPGLLGHVAPLRLALVHATVLEQDLAAELGRVDVVGAVAEEELVVEGVGVGHEVVLGQRHEVDEEEGVGVLGPHVVDVQRVADDIDFEETQQRLLLAPLVGRVGFVGGEAALFAVCVHGIRVWSTGTWETSFWAFSFGKRFLQFT